MLWQLPKGVSFVVFGVEIDTIGWVVLCEVFGEVGHAEADEKQSD